MRKRYLEAMETEDLRRENERLRSRIELLEAEMTQDPPSLTRGSLANYLVLGLRPRPYKGVDGVVYDVFDLLDNATRLYGKDAVRKALDLND